MHEGAALHAKLSVEVESIDDADYMLGFIERISEPDNKLSEIEAEVRKLRAVKDFLDLTGIYVESGSFE